jgi:hypothetical protein
MKLDTDTSECILSSGLNCIFLDVDNITYYDNNITYYIYLKLFFCMSWFVSILIIQMRNFANIFS